VGGPPALNLGEGLTTTHRKETTLLRNDTQGRGRAVIYTVMNLRVP